jgi:dipeptidyl aminopeptidase/acylaminoacyl peptidase
VSSTPAATAAAAETDTLRESVARMARIGSCISPALAPDGSQLVFVSDLSGVPQVWMVDSAGGWPELLTAFDDQVREVRWSPDGAWLAFTLAPGGGLNSQIYLMRADAKEATRITAGGRTNNWLWRWHDESRLLYASSERAPDALDAYLFDVATRRGRLIAENNGIGTALDLSPASEVALVWRMVNRSDSNLYLVDLTTGTESLLTPHEGPGSFDSGGFSRDGRRVFLSSNKDRELAAFAVVDLDGLSPGEITTLVERNDAELERVVFTRDRTTALLVWNAGGSSECEFVALDSLERTPVPRLPADVVLAADFSPDGRTLALNLAGAATPPDVWLVEQAGGTFRQVTHSPRPGVDMAELVRPELVKFPAHDGLELSGWLYAPPERRPAPVVVSFHGGPEAQERPRFSSTYQALLAHGIAVFAPNVRGSAGFGKTFVNLDNGAGRFEAVKDIESCVRFLVDSGVADPGRIGAMGGSYGGYMTMAALTQYPEHFAAGVTVCGVVNFETFFANTEPWMRAISKVEYGDPDTEPDLLHELSPIHRIDRVSAPTLVLHGANDTNVPVVEAEQVAENLRARDVPVELVLFPDEGHGFTKTANKIEAAVATVRWFVRYLQA